MEVIFWSIDKPKPYLRNARKIPEKAIAKVAKSLAEFGWKQPLVVDPQGVIIVGHTRLLAAKRLGWNEVPVLVAHDLTPAQVKAYRLMDNRSHDETDWDLDILGLELQDLSLEAIDMELTGFDLPEIERSLLHGLDDAAADACPEAPEAPVTRLGDVWVMGAHRLVCGDSTKAEDVALALCEGVKAEMLFTDPPYGVAYDGGHFHSGNVNIKRSREKLQADESAKIYFDFLPVVMPFVDGPCYMWFAHSKAYEVFSALHNSDCQISSVLIWHKTNATYAAMNAQYKQRHEPCVYFKPKGSTLRWVGPPDESTLWEEKRDSVNSLHPTQKPVCLAERAMRNHKADTVLDVFAGSGSTCIAAERLNRRCVSIEIDPKYCDVIVNRWQQFTGKQAGLAGDGRTFEQVACDRTETIAV